MQALNEIAAQAKPVADKARAYSTRAWGEIARLAIPPPAWFLGQCFALGYGRVRLHAIFGQGGLGKSRISMNIARNQVLSMPFGGMSTGTKPLRHLFMGTENGLHRLQHDIRKMSSGLHPEQVALLDEHIFLATLEAADDPYVTLSDPENVERWRVTIAERRPDVLWVDPWGDVQAGDANAESDARWTIAELTKILGTVNRDSAMNVLAHARTGAKNIMEAIGYDGANFGKGSKALYSCARSVFNLAPGSEEENPPVVVACPKNNDAARPKAFALTLNMDNMTYQHDPEATAGWRVAGIPATRDPANPAKCRWRDPEAICCVCATVRRRAQQVAGVFARHLARHLPPGGAVDRKGHRSDGVGERVNEKARSTQMDRERNGGRLVPALLCPPGVVNGMRREAAKPRPCVAEAKR